MTGDVRFLRHHGIYRSDASCPARTRGGAPPPVGRRPASVKDATEGARLGSSSAMSSGRLFLDRVARQQSPSLLHRQLDHKHWTKSLERHTIERYCVFSAVSHPRGAPHLSV